MKATSTYDKAGRLLTLTNADPFKTVSSYVYEYGDGRGNRTKQIETNASAAAPVGLAASEETTYTYDAANRLKSVTYPADPSYPNGRVVTYTYDKVGNREGESETVPEGAAQNAGAVIVTRAGVFDDNNRLITLDTTPGPAAGAVTPAEAGIHTLYYSFDGLGSVTNLTTATDVAASYHLDAWGNYRFTSELAPSKNRFGFTGYYWDNEAGLYYAKARFYDPEVARFTQADSFLGNIDNPPSLHRYQYAAANPTFFIDRTGNAYTEAQLREIFDMIESLSRRFPRAAGNQTGAIVDAGLHRVIRDLASKRVGKRNGALHVLRLAHAAQGVPRFEGFQLVQGATRSFRRFPDLEVDGKFIEAAAWRFPFPPPDLSALARGTPEYFGALTAHRAIAGKERQLFVDLLNHRANAPLVLRYIFSKDAAQYSFLIRNHFARLLRSPAMRARLTGELGGDARAASEAVRILGGAEAALTDLLTFAR